MLKYNLLIVGAVLFALTIALASCDDKVEVVSQDTSYQLDPDFVFVDIPGNFNFDPSNILYLSGQTNIALNAKTDGETVVIAEGNTIPLNVRLKKALDHDVTVKLVEDPELLEDYTGETMDFESFPSGAYSMPEIIIPAGSTEASAALTINNPDVLSRVPGYLLPLRLEFLNGQEEVKISSNRFALFVKMNVTFGRDNVDSSNTPFTGDFFNSVITFQSNRTAGLQSLKDGNHGGGSWYPGNTTHYLVISLPGEETITGMRLHTLIGSYQLASFDVLVEEEGRGYVPHGNFSINAQTSTLHVKFKQPMQTKSIRLENFRSLVGGVQPDVTEVYLVR